MRNPEDRLKCEICDEMYYPDDSESNEPLFFCSDGCERFSLELIKDHLLTSNDMHK